MPTRPSLPTRARSFGERLLGTPASLVLACVLFVLVNYVSARHYRRFDWTRHRLFSLSDRSVQIVRGLHAPVDLYVLMAPGERQFSDVSELAQRYAATSPLIRVHTIDPDRQRDRLIELARRTGIRVLAQSGSASDVTSDSAVLLLQGDRHWEIPRQSLSGLSDEEGDEGAGQRVAVAQATAERALSEGILRLAHDEAIDLCVDAAHGELPLQGEPAQSLAALSEELSHDNVHARPIEIRGGGPVPGSCDVLLIARPTQAFVPAEADAVERYVRAGGNALLLLDPQFVDRHWAPTGLESVARLGGIELTRSVVIEADPQAQLEGELPVLFFAHEMGDHPITASLRRASARVLVDESRGLRRASGVEAVPVSLLRTSAQAWGETGTADAVQNGQLQRDANDLAGPVDLAMASQVPGVHAPAEHPSREAAGRMVVIGFSGHLATGDAFGPQMQSQVDNSFVMIASIGWLSARRELVEIPARPALSGALVVSQQDLRHIRLYALLLVPLAAALIGIAVWRARRAA